MNNDKKGNFLKNLRLERKITQQELGEMLHYSDKAISKWEHGKAFPNNSETLESIAKIFNVTVEELLYGERKTKSLKLIVYNKRKIPKFILVLMLLVTFIVSISCISMKNNVTYYSLEGEGSNFILENIKLTLTNNKSILEFSKINSDYGSTVSSFILFYYENNVVHVVYEAINKDYTLEEKFPSSKYNFKKLVEQDVYLKVIYDTGQTETIKLIINKDVKENDKVTQQRGKSTENYHQLTDFEKFLLEEDFIIEEDNFLLKLDDSTIYYKKNSGFYIITEIEGYNYEIKYTFNAELITLTNNASKNKEKNIFLAKSPIRPQNLSGSGATLIKYIGYLAYHYENLYQ